MYKEIDCNDCFYINITEEEQKIANRAGFAENHRCMKHDNVKLVHGRNHPYIEPICNGKDFEPKGNDKNKEIEYTENEKQLAKLIVRELMKNKVITIPWWYCLTPVDFIDEIVTKVSKGESIKKLVKSEE